VLVLAQIPHWAMLEHMHYKGRVPQERIGASPAARRSLVRLEMRLLYVSQETITAAISGDLGNGGGMTSGVFHHRSMSRQARS